MFFTISIGAKTYITVFMRIPFHIPDRCNKQIGVTINTEKHFCFAKIDNNAK